MTHDDNCSIWPHSSTYYGACDCLDLQSQHGHIDRLQSSAITIQLIVIRNPQKGILMMNEELWAKAYDLSLADTSKTQTQHYIELDLKAAKLLDRACACGQCLFQHEPGSKYCKHHRVACENHDRKREAAEERHLRDVATFKQQAENNETEI